MSGGYFKKSVVIFFLFFFPGEDKKNITMPSTGVTNNHRRLTLHTAPRSLSTQTLCDSGFFNFQLCRFQLWTEISFFSNFLPTSEGFRELWRQWKFHFIFKLFKLVKNHIYRRKINILRPLLAPAEGWGPFGPLGALWALPGAFGPPVGLQYPNFELWTLKNWKFPLLWSQFCAI